jgi:hypothetical protein
VIEYRYFGTVALYRGALVVRLLPLPLIGLVAIYCLIRASL